MGLFDQRERTDSSPASNEEDSFSFYNRAGGVVWERIRQVVEAWFAEYPNEDGADLRKRFRSKRQGAHLGAFWELYLHQLFTRLEYEVEVHPAVPGTDRRPDFLLSRDNERLYLEGAVVFSGVVDDERDGLRTGWIEDAINQGNSPNFMVSVEIEQYGNKRPKAKRVYRPIEDWLAELDPDAATSIEEELTVELDDWRLCIAAIPLAPEARGERDRRRLVGIGGVTAGYIDDKEQLRDTLKHKRSRYGEPDLPLVVAVNLASSFPHDEDIASALYGSLAYEYNPDLPGQSKPVRQRDGTWMGPNGPTGQRLSAVLSAVQLHPGSVLKTWPRLWLNPWAHHPFESDWPFTEWRCSDRGEVTSEDRYLDLPGVFDLPRDWPGPEKPFA